MARRPVPDVCSRRLLFKAPDCRTSGSCSAHRHSGHRGRVGPRDGNAGTPSGEQPKGHYYTVRDWDPEVLELVLDVVVHEAGVAPGCAQQSATGDEVSTLERSVRAASWPDGAGYFWMAGEAGQMRWT
ncbi:MAG: siderophore-interacting protein [Actinomycetota bacterium]|nr:siderophore-interacting protein [Actinomycetota bacterium]